MNVLHVIPSLAPSDGGPSRAIALMERTLTDQGVRVETATTDHAGPGLRNGKPGAAPLEENGVTRWYFPKQMEFYKAAPAFASWIDANVHRFDLVHIHALFSYMPVVAARAARRAGVPYVIRPLGTLSTYGMQQRRRWLKASSLRWIEGPLLHHAAAVHFTSESEAVEARDTGVPMHEAIIPLGIEVEDPFLASPPAEARETVKTLLFLSRLDPKKNLEGLLGAMSLLGAEAPDVQLVVAGDGERMYRQALKAMASPIRFAERVRWLGHVEGDAKAKAFASADVFVLPSFSENFGIAAVEAMAAGLPVVLGEGVAIASDVVRAGAGIAVRPEPQAIAEGLRRIIGDNVQRQAMARNARQLAWECYSVKAMGTRLKQLYSNILDFSHELPGSR